METEQIIKESLSKTLVFDIETSAFKDDGTPIDISSEFNLYVKRAKVKWIGLYSFRDNAVLSVPVAGHEQEIKDYINGHDTLVGFNSEEFDFPILYNNRLVSTDKWFMQLDLMRILGNDKFKGHKMRAMLMGIDLKSNRLKEMALKFGLETQKGDIDYKIFFKDTWTEQETIDIKKYLEADIMATKQLLEKLIDFWKVFIPMLPEQYQKDWSFVRRSIAALTYFDSCNVLGVEPSFSDDRTEVDTEEMGGNVIEPRVEEARDVWYVDVASLYPHVYAMFNLHAEIVGMNAEKFEQHAGSTAIWNGNEVFQCKGYYDVEQQSKLGKHLMDLYKQRRELKRNDPKNPLQYAIKILLNSHYGAQRSPIFEQIHTPNSGWDCCWLGQQIQAFAEKRLKEFGYDTIAGDTDSLFIKKVESNNDTRERLTMCLKSVAQEINMSVPFPQDTFEIAIEKRIDYIKYVKFDKKKEEDADEFKKKMYVYVHTKDNERIVEVVGLKIIKGDATKLGPRIFEQYIRPRIIQDLNASFDTKWVGDLIRKELETSWPELAIEYRCKSADSYKPNKDGSESNNIRAQISRGYLFGRDGTVALIKNKSVGKAGVTAKYCTIDEAREANFTWKDVDYKQILAELQPFSQEKLKL